MSVPDDRLPWARTAAPKIPPTNEVIVSDVDFTRAICFILMGHVTAPYSKTLLCRNNSRGFLADRQSAYNGKDLHLRMTLHQKALVCVSSGCEWYGDMEQRADASITRLLSGKHEVGLGAWS